MTPDQIKDMIQRSMATSVLSAIYVLCHSITGRLSCGSAISCFHPTFWYIESGASNHLSVVKHSFIDSQLYAGNRQITADDEKICLFCQPHRDIDSIKHVPFTQSIC